MRAAFVAMVGLAFCIAGCGTAAPSPSAPGSFAPPAARWQAPSDPASRATAAGLAFTPKEYTDHHAHAHLDVFVDGAPVLVPAGIGIDITDPDVDRFDDPDGLSYAGIELCARPCISTLHTHAESGVLHMEASEAAPFTLAQFFTEWGVKLDASCLGEICDRPIKAYVDGQAVSGDPGAITLTDRKEIAIVVGAPPATIPSTADFDRP